MLVDAIGQAARSSGVAPPHRPWQPPLPSVATAAEVAAITAAPSDGLVGESGADRGADVIGLVDDPVQQRRGPLRWDVDAGNLALVGALGAGTTSTLLAVAAAQCRTRPPDRCHVYVVDAAGDAALDPLAGIEHCGGVVRLGERERLARLLRRLVAEIDRRGSEAVGRAERGVRTLLLVDGLGTLRSALAAIDDVALLAALDRVLADGPAVGVVTAFTATGSAVSTAMPAAERWVFHLDDPAAARALCGSGRPVPDRSPGRLRIASSGLEAQVVHLDDPLADLPRRTGSTGPPGIGVLPERVRIADVAASSRRGAADERSARSSDDPASASKSLLVGLVGESLAPATLCLPAGDHVFIGGLARTGRSAALRRIAAAWREATPNGRVVAASACDPLSREDLVGRADEGTDPCPLLVVVDDAERVEDDRGVLREVLDGRHEHVTVAIAARLDAVRSSYGHWTREITRSRCGLIMTAASEIDGDLLGVTLPRRSLPGPRPGLGWLVDGSGHRLVQVALDG
jgi:S-DNA-T family DNA segregation ATPase FtsK/SpoIIIE